MYAKFMAISGLKPKIRVYVENYVTSIIDDRALDD